MMKRISNILDNKDWVYYVSLCVLSIISFSIVFMLPHNNLVKTISGIVRYNNSRFLMGLIILLIISLSIKNARLSNLAASLVIFPIFAFALNGLWASMYSETNIIAGILPRKDALSFFTSSMTLVQKGYMVGYTARRPLFGGFLAAILWLFGENVQISLISIAFICAATTFLALIEVRKLINPAAAIIFFIPQFLFYRHTIGNVMSEILSYSFGMLAISFFLLAYQKKKSNYSHSVLMFLLGFFFFTLSQLTRPGAIVTLPLLVIFGKWLFGESNKKSWRLIAYSLSIVVFLFLFNGFMFNYLTENSSSQMNNSLYGIYGVIRGGKDWGQIHRDYPELLSLDAGIREQKMLEVTISEFLAEPVNFFKGMNHQFFMIFSTRPVTTYNVFSYMLSNNRSVDNLLIYTYYLFSVLGVIYSIIKYKEQFYRFILILILGFLFSLPIAPAYHAEYMRYYPATIPLLGLIPAIGLSVINKFPIKNKVFSFFTNPRDSSEHRGIHYGFAVVLIGLTLVFPILLKRNSENPEKLSNDCMEGESEAIIDYFPNSEILVNSKDKTWRPYISEGNFKLRIHDMPDKKVIAAFESITLPTAIFPSIDQTTNKPLYVVTDFFSLPEQTTTLRVCGTIDEAGILHARTLEEIQATP